MSRFGLQLISSLCFVPSISLAQTAVLEGNVREETMHSPLEAAALTLEIAPPIGPNGSVAEIPAANQQRMMVFAGAGGAFTFPSVPAGIYVLAVRRIGYAPFETLVDLTPRTHRVEVTLKPISVELAPVEITASTRLQQQLDEVGFLHRRKEGFGKFMDAAEIARTHPFDVVSLFRPLIKGCTMIYIDGMPRSLHEITVDQIAGFEYYARRVMTPAEFANPRVDCGSLVVWTWIRTSN